MTAVPINYRRPRRRHAPLQTVSQCECVAQPSDRRVECGRCGQTFAGGAVVQVGKPRSSKVMGFRVVTLMVYCDGCNHWQRWCEAWDAASGPTGQVVGTPDLITDRRTVETLLRVYPQSTGVLQR